MRLDPDILQRCWFLAGPTACGKTAVGLELARRLGAEIVSLDSMTLYRAMDVGTDKPSAEARAAVPHHLIDIIAPDEDWSLADYLQAADDACRAIVARGRTPLFVGGTGLYLRGLLRGLFQGPPADWEFRRSLEAQAAARPAGFLHERLGEVDPATAARVHPNDDRRVIRALEVHRLTGRPLSEQQQHGPLPPHRRPRHVYWLEPPRDWLHRRIDERVERMIGRGLIEEVRGLLAASRPPGRTARQALGYKEVIDHLTAGVDLGETIALIQRRTRQFAKRQYTWFRNLPECTSVPIAGEETAEQLARSLADRASGLGGPSMGT